MYLDTKGLVACWRETLLAQKVLQGLTKCYRNHSQLIRFSSHPNPLQAIGLYLHHLQAEGTKRGFKFDYSKIIFAPQTAGDQVVKISVTSEQVKYEFMWLLSKLKKRDDERYKTFSANKLETHTDISIHPLFDVSVGDIEHWEKVVPSLLKESKKRGSEKSETKKAKPAKRPMERVASEILDEQVDAIKKRLRKRY